MNKIKNLLGKIVAIAYFICPMLIIIIYLLFAPVNCCKEISQIIDIGFSGQQSKAMPIGLCGFFIGLSLLIPPLRKMYSVLPWLYSFTKMFFMNLIIMGIAIEIIKYGYEVNNGKRHTIFILLMILQLVISRIAMCIYFKSKPIAYSGEAYHE